MPRNAGVHQLALNLGVNSYEQRPIPQMMEELIAEIYVEYTIYSDILWFNFQK